MTAGRVEVALVVVAAMLGGAACEGPNSCGQPSGTHAVGHPGSGCVTPCASADDCEEGERCSEATWDDELYCSQTCEASHAVEDVYCSCACPGDSTSGVCSFELDEGNVCAADRPEIDVTRVRVSAPEGNVLRVVGDRAVWVRDGTMRLLEVVNLGNASGIFERTVVALDDAGLQRWSFDVSIVGLPEDQLVLRGYRDEEGLYDATGGLHGARRGSSDLVVVVADPESADGSVIVPRLPDCLRIEPSPQLDLAIVAGEVPEPGRILISSSCAQDTNIDVTLLSTAGWYEWGDALVYPDEIEERTVEVTETQYEPFNLARVKLTREENGAQVDTWTAVSIAVFLQE